MALICIFCRKEYHHDRKICQLCEDYSIYSGLAFSNENNGKWRCDKFLELNTIFFERKKKDYKYSNVIRSAD